MLLRLLAIFILAFAAAGIVYGLNKYLFKNRLPNWVMPASIATVIVLFHVIEQYSWYPRKLSELGDKYIVVREFDAPSIIYPWTYIKPAVTKITVINRDNLQPLEGAENILGSMMITTSYMQEIYYAPFAFDCASGDFGPYYGDLNAVEWAKMDTEMQRKICGE